MKKHIYWSLVTLITTFCLSTAFGEYDPTTQIGLPEGAKARLGKGAISKLAYAPDGTRLAVGSSIGVWIYDIESSKALDLFPMSGVSCVAFSPDGKTLVSGSGRNLVLWDMATGEPLRTFIDEYQMGVFSVAFSPDGKTLASGHAGGFLRLWEAATGKHIRLFSGMGGEEGGRLSFEHTGPVRSIAFSPDGKTLVSAGYYDRGTEVRLWETATGKHIRLLDSVDGEENSLDSVAFSPDGQTLAVGLGAGGITLWDTTKTDKTPQFLEAPEGRYMRRVLSLAFSPDGTLLASCGEDKIVYLWDVKTGELLRTFIGHKDDVFSVAFSPDGKTVASSSKESVRLWNSEGEEHLRSVITHAAILNVAFSPDGKFLTSGNKDNTDRSGNTKTDKSLINLIRQKGRIFSMAFSPDGSMLATGVRDKTPIGKRDDIVWLWDTTTGEHIRTFTGHLNRVTCVAFSPDGKILASGSEDETVLLWDLKTGKHPRILIGHNDEVLRVKFSPDGKTLASRSKDGIVLLWDVQ